MTDAAEHLEALRQRIADLADEEMPVDYLSRLTVIKPDLQLPAVRYSSEYA